ncbi:MULTISPECIES: ketosteroid isomerase-related protein [Deinococcus]|jgi:steroid delta-isomerase-like uncharacterized protein|uniref:Isopropylmalate/homocitrate/citramalate synthase n=2 Tax=Deinococcus TaxID=1298 RepID=A0A221SY57_9DEIO|nr:MULTISPECIES: ketosteroid isomerase-related protein [Deinococcus]ASN81551.1 isopropylmalate/homocitrate/citramalate synthase [Deinococcus ficus]MDP9765065.1 steroid delta-isomerase-like uncharacterized protein [Deinococcus enclensis]GHF83654.1 hypothetical protein GCM10017782_21520 [Deinococcus ficus]
MHTAPARDLLTRYYAAFNDGRMQGMLELLTDDVKHDINEGGTEIGRDAFRAFLVRMNAHYQEQVRNLVIMVSEDGTRASAEFVIHGQYVKTDEGLPEARGQRYVLPVGAFFTLRDGQIARVTNYYNLREWCRQVEE